LIHSYRCEGLRWLPVINRQMPRSACWLLLRDPLLTPIGGA
jgi:hypothetical protein